MLIFKATIEQRNAIRNLIEKISAFEPPVDSSVNINIQNIRTGNPLELLLWWLPNYLSFAYYINNLPIKSTSLNFINFVNTLSTSYGMLIHTLSSALLSNKGQLKQAQGVLGRALESKPSPQKPAPSIAPTSTENIAKPPPTKPEPTTPQRTQQQQTGLGQSLLERALGTGPTTATEVQKTPPDTSPRIGREVEGAPGGVGHGAGDTNIARGHETANRFDSSWGQLIEIAKILGHDFRTSMINSLVWNFGMDDQTAANSVDAILGPMWSSVAFAFWGSVAVTPLVAARLLARVNVPIVGPILGLMDKIPGGIYELYKYIKRRSGDELAKLKSIAKEYAQNASSPALETLFKQARQEFHEKLRSIFQKTLIGPLEHPDFANLANVISPVMLHEMLERLHQSYDALVTSVSLGINLGAGHDIDSIKQDAVRERQRLERELQTAQSSRRSSINNLRIYIQQACGLAQRNQQTKEFYIDEQRKQSNQESEIKEIIRQTLGRQPGSPITTDDIRSLTDEQVISIAVEFKNRLENYLHGKDPKGFPEHQGYLNDYRRNISTYETSNTQIPNLNAALETLKSSPVRALGRVIPVNIAVPVVTDQGISHVVVGYNLGQLLNLASQRTGREIVEEIWNRLQQEQNIRNHLLADNNIADQPLFEQSIKALLALSLYRSLDGLKDLPEVAEFRNRLLSYLVFDENSLFHADVIKQLESGTPMRQQIYRFFTNNGSSDPLEDYRLHSEYQKIPRAVLDKLYTTALLAATSSNPLYNESVTRALSTASENLLFLNHFASLVIGRDSALYMQFLRDLTRSGQIDLTDTQNILRTLQGVFGQKYPDVFSNIAGLNDAEVKEQILQAFASKTQNVDAIERYRRARQALMERFKPGKIPKVLDVVVRPQEVNPVLRALRSVGHTLGHVGVIVGIGASWDFMADAILKYLGVKDASLLEDGVVRGLAAALGGSIVYRAFEPLLDFIAPKGGKGIVYKARLVEGLSVADFYKNILRATDTEGKPTADDLYRKLERRYAQFSSNIENRLGLTPGSFERLGPKSFSLIRIFNDSNTVLSREDLRRFLEIIHKIDSVGLKDLRHPVHSLVLDHLFRPDFNSEFYIANLLGILIREGGFNPQSEQDLKLIRPLAGFLTLRSLVHIFGATGVNETAASFVAEKLRVLAQSQQQYNLSHILRENINKLNTYSIWDDTNQLNEKIKEWAGELAKQPIRVTQTLPQATIMTRRIRPGDLNELIDAAATAYGQRLQADISNKLKKLNIMSPDDLNNFENTILRPYVRRVSDAYRSLLRFGAQAALEGVDPSPEALKILFIDSLNDINMALYHLASGLAASEYLDESNRLSILKTIYEVQNDYLTRHVLDVRTLRGSSSTLNQANRLELEAISESAKITSEWLRHLRDNKNLDPRLRELPQLRGLFLKPEEINITSAREKLPFGSIRPYRPQEPAFRLDLLHKEWTEWARNRGLRVLPRLHGK